MPRHTSYSLTSLSHHVSLIDLIVLMDEEGYLPDHHIKHALVRALTPSHLIPINFPPELPATSSTGEGSKVSQSNVSSNINRMKFSERVKRCFGIEPAEVCSFEHWASLRRPAATSSIVLRSSVPAEFGGSPRYWDKDGKHVTANYFSAAISSSTSAHGPAEPSLLSPRTTHKTSEHGPPPSSSTTRSQSTSSSSSSSSSLPQSRAARRKDAWSINRLEGLIQQLTWNNIGKTFHSNGQRRSYAASKKLHTDSEERGPAHSSGLSARGRSHCWAWGHALPRHQLRNTETADVVGANAGMGVIPRRSEQIHRALCVLRQRVYPAILCAE